MKTFKLALILTGALFVQSAASAVLYEFDGTANSPIPGTGGAFSFTYLAPNFVTTDTTVFPGALLSCTPACQNVQLLPSHPNDPTDSNQVSFTELGGFNATYFFFFDPAAFQTLGVHNTILLPGVNDATLTVSTPTTGIPEPGAFGLLSLALAAFTVLSRRQVVSREKAQT